ncbi:MFS transporter [Microbacterium murale]|uniref:MFS transporter n=1 Tax=Microbacterium murale TaxID=1081040 RepID=A0ABQ1S0H9_9MICO|nr:MFS transporter [Microbacterium murale]GGD85252.1 MFS transporter [Microbacterium murale]
MSADDFFAGHIPRTRSYRRLIAGLFFAGVATFAQLYSLQAVLPQVAVDLEVPASTAALTVSAATLGIAVAVIPWSLVADRIGRIPAMAIGIIAATAFGLAAPLSTEIAVLLVLRLGEGLALGAVPAVALAYLSEEVHARHVAAAAGSYTAGTTVGGLTGRLVAGPIGEAFDWRIGVWSVTLLCTAAAVLFLWLVPRARRFVPGRMRADAGPGKLARLIRALRSPRLLALYAQGFLLMGAFVAVYNYLGFHLIAPPFLLPVWLVTLLFLAYLAGTVSSPWAGSLAVRHGRRIVLLGAIGLFVVGAALMYVPSPIVILIGLVVFTGGFFGAHAIASSWAPVLADADSRAQAPSLYYFAYYAGSSLFGWALGVVFGSAGWGWFLGAVIFMGVVAAVIAAVALHPTRSPHRR